MRMRQEATSRAEGAPENTRPIGPEHAYGLRHMGEGLWVVVRVVDGAEETLTRPERKAMALGALVERVETDAWT
ncbi:MAG: hypothetical protein MUF00_01695 [Gemmatimonadaceae bacterium]|jgi:hypothetical protein|nr:hypothetical protein [Gemmatimonadaceae bacterium]